MNDAPKWHVAISFLFADEPVARDLTERLTGFKVFFFPKAQEELAGTDGLETLRTTFREDSLLNVVLYRMGWGETRWTRVEETGIKEAGISDRGWDTLMFVSLDTKSVIQKWFTETKIRFNFYESGP